MPDPSAPRPGSARPDAAGHFGRFGGRFMPEALMAPLDELEQHWREAMADPAFTSEFDRMLREYAGVPSLLYDAERFSELVGARVLLKREDLNHTGAHKIRNVLGQLLLTQKMGKKRVIAETGAGQHGVATATACAYFGLDCVVYMGEVDTQRQALNVARMKMLGAEVVAVKTGSRTLKDAINEALRDWVANVDSTHYVLGTAAGAAPVPRDGARLHPRHRRRGARSSASTSPAGFPTPCSRASAAAPTRSACSRRSSRTTASASTASSPVARASRPVGTPPRSPPATSGVLHGTRSFLLQDEDGQTIESHSISAGLDYPGVGPEHAWLAETGRATYRPITDAQAMDAMATLARSEGIIPAIESAHALAGAYDVARELGPRRRARRLSLRAR